MHLVGTLVTDVISLLRSVFPIDLEFSDFSDEQLSKNARLLVSFGDKIDKLVEEETKFKLSYRRYIYIVIKSKLII